MTRPTPISVTAGPAGDLPGVLEGDPRAFLAAFRGEPRGFWGRGDRWVAWGGALARIEVPKGLAGSRFERVRREAASALAGLGGGEGRGVALSPWDSPRFFGGFAFTGSGPSDPGWRGFASASFVLPRAVLSARDGAVRFHSPERSGEVEPAPAAEPGAGATGPPGSRARGPGGSDRAIWARAVGKILDAIRDGRLRKVVLARFVDAELDSPVDPLAALSFLRADNVRAHVFHFELSPGRVFLGAAPEILAKLRGGRFEATAVAGSMPRAREREEDEALALRLLRSEKNLAEHGLTLEEMLEGLEGRLVGMGVDPEPRVLRLAGIQHLETVIRGSAAAGEDILSLVEALHPTPAVCGRPRAEALRVLAEEEPFDRGWFAGPVGWFDASGEGNFVPALRSAVGEGRDWRLFAGAGIVTGSEADEEWQETELKLEPALRALRAGAGPAPL